MSENPNYEGLAERLGSKRPSDLKMKNSAFEHDDDAVMQSIDDNWDALVKDGVRRMGMLARYILKTGCEDIWMAANLAAIVM